MRPPSRRLRGESPEEQALAESDNESEKESNREDNRSEERMVSDEEEEPVVNKGKRRQIEEENLDSGDSSDRESVISNAMSDLNLGTTSTSIF